MQLTGPMLRPNITRRTTGLQDEYWQGPLSQRRASTVVILQGCLSHSGLVIGLFFSGLFSPLKEKGTRGIHLFPPVGWPPSPSLGCIFFIYCVSWIMVVVLDIAAVVAVVTASFFCLKRYKNRFCVSLVQGSHILQALWSQTSSSSSFGRDFFPVSSQPISLKGNLLLTVYSGSVLHLSIRSDAYHDIFRLFSVSQKKYCHLTAFLTWHHSHTCPHSEYFCISCNTFSRQLKYAQQLHSLLQILTDLHYSWLSSTPTPGIKTLPYISCLRNPAVKGFSVFSVFPLKTISRSRPQTTANSLSFAFFPLFAVPRSTPTPPPMRQSSRTDVENSSPVSFQVSKNEFNADQF